jgi:DNA adenine methylase
VKFSKPYLKWAGGKGRLLAYILAALPERIDRFYDLTVGGGALPLRLHELGRLTGAVTLSDTMAALINLHRMTREQPARIQAVGAWPCDRDSFYRIRDADLSSSESAEALRIAYANRRGYNGLIRHNRHGKLSTTWGGDVTKDGKQIQFWPKDMPERIAAFGRLVERSRLIVQSCLTAEPEPGSVVYVDPPYPETSPTATFNDYSTPFGWPEQEALAARARTWARNGCLVLISNADLPRIRYLYQGCYVQPINATRTIGAPSHSISKSGELLIRVV